MRRAELPQIDLGEAYCAVMSLIIGKLGAWTKLFKIARVLFIMACFNRFYGILAWGTGYDDHVNIASLI